MEWYEAFIGDLELDDYVFILDTIGGVHASLCSVENGEYTWRNRELFNGKDGNIAPYDTYKDIFMDMMEHDCAIHVYRYADGRFTEHRQFTRRDYDPFVYEECQREIMLRTEFGLEPHSAENKEAFAKALKKAEKFMKSLLYACYVGDTPAVIERAKTASKAQLNRKLQCYGTPLTYCAQHNDLEGFRAVAEAGADFSVTCAGGTVSPMNEAIKHSPDIVLYVHSAFPEIFEQHFKNWDGRIPACTDLRVYELMYSLYGTEGMAENLLFGLVQYQNAVGLRFALEHGADFLEYRDSYYKMNALEFAEMRYQNKGKPDESFREVYEMLKTAAEARK